MTAAQENATGVPFRVIAAAEVRAHLGRRGLTGRTFAKRIKKDQTWLSRRLNGQIPMTTDDLEICASGLDMTVMEMLADIPKDPAEVSIRYLVETPHLYSVPCGSTHPDAGHGGADVALSAVA